MTPRFGFDGERWIFLGLVFLTALAFLTHRGQWSQVHRGSIPLSHPALLSTGN